MSTDDPTQQIPTGASPVDATRSFDTQPFATPPGATSWPSDTPAVNLVKDGPEEPVAPGSARAPEASDAGAPAVETERARLRVGTVVWGLVIAAIGAGFLAVALGATLDLQLAMIALLGFAGVAMLVGSVVGGLRRPRR